MAKRAAKMDTLQQVPPQEAQQDNTFDITPDAWYNDYLPQRKSGVSVGTLTGDGKVNVAPVEIKSNDDIIRFMFLNGMIKDSVHSRRYRDKLFGNTAQSPTDVNISTPSPAKVHYQPDPFEQELDDILTQPSKMPDTSTSVPYPSPIADPPAPVTTAHKKAVREKRVPDFKPIQMEWLQAKPIEPNILVQFSSELGDFETYYHRIFESEAVLYLAFDRRCKFGRFVPKMGGSVVTITVGEDQFTGVLWTAGKFEVGVLELTPFVIVNTEDVEEEQTNY